MVSALSPFFIIETWKNEKVKDLSVHNFRAKKMTRQRNATQKKNNKDLFKFVLVFFWKY